MSSGLPIFSGALLSVWVGSAVAHAQQSRYVFGSLEQCSTTRGSCATQVLAVLRTVLPLQQVGGNITRLVRVVFMDSEQFQVTYNCMFLLYSHLNV